jgi:glycolate oxidase iron-sulfur subunit
MTSSPSFPLELADRCVKCGLCLPHCPTYGLMGVEGESPRGRIALMQGLATGRLEPGPQLASHLENCLGCRACERVCPAGVPYGELIDAGRELLVRRGAGPSRTGRLLAATLRRPGLLRMAVRLARLPGARQAGRRLGALPARALSLLPADARPPSRAVSAGPGDGVRGEALLFLGCVGGAIDGRTLDDTRIALAAAGWRVRIPEQQGCCGALDLHAGRPGEAAALASRNVSALAGEGPIVACATGCAATLKEYARVAGAAGARLAARIRDPAELLAEAALPLREGPWRNVLLHVPCTQRNVTGTAAATRMLLGRLPGLSVRELPAGCCGAAGETFLTRQELADALLAPLLRQLEADPPEVLVTSNIGCAMHFRAGLERAGLNVPVLHPTSLVAAALN